MEDRHLNTSQIPPQPHPLPRRLPCSGDPISIVVCLLGCLYCSIRSCQSRILHPSFRRSRLSFLVRFKPKYSLGPPFGTIARSSAVSGLLCALLQFRVQPHSHFIVWVPYRGSVLRRSLHQLGNQIHVLRTSSIRVFADTAITSPVIKEIFV